MQPIIRQTVRLNNANLLFNTTLINQSTYARTAGSQRIPSRRNLQTTSNLWAPQHEQDAARLINRDALNPSRSEGTGSGTDDEVASHYSSFDPKNTAPESEIEAAGRESKPEKIRVIRLMLALEIKR
uniref:Uncharacterized protein n=1 Tax=Talaromyces marneffei PM1 TaxID=1077442 RepID=A0A093Y736_TALMA